MRTGRTAWHITFGTYGTRLHGGQRLTVRRSANRLSDATYARNDALQTSERNLMAHPPVVLTHDMRTLIQHVMPTIATRGGWHLFTCAAETDHVHIFLEAERTIHGKQIRPLIKRWLTQSLNDQFESPASSRWWAKGGSTKVVDNNAYRERVCAYIDVQRAM